MKKQRILWIGVSIAAIVVIALYLWNARLTRIQITTDTTDTMVVAEMPPIEWLYDIPRDSFLIEEYNVKRNQNLSDILLRAGLDYPTIHKMATVPDTIFDVRKIKTGQPYTLFYTSDTLHLLRHFVYAIDNTDYVVFSFKDSVTAQRKSKPIVTVEKTVAAQIESSLWNAITGHGLTPMLALELSEIFAWTVDFFGIEKGDYFKVIYNEQFVDSISVGISEVKAAVFHHHRKDYYAFHFNEDGEWNFFDEEGNNLKKAFLKAPLKFSRISSRFSNGRLHPVLKIVRPHHGIDYAAPTGTPVYALGDGRIIHKGWDTKGGGNYLKIRHNSVYTTVYMHLQGFAKGIAQGTQVRQGDLIGFVGSTGMSTGPHLDFRVFKNDRPVDPLKIESPSAEPVKETNKQYFLQHADSLKSVVDQIKIKHK